MKPPSTALLRVFSPLWQPAGLAWTARGCLAQQKQLPQMQRAEFSATTARHKKGSMQRRDMRVTRIRYFLQHPLTPRPLRFSRTRFLRHWTIHRAWTLYQSKLRQRRQLELQQQYQSMANACEALRLIDGQGMTAEERARLDMPPETGKEMGRLYRIAMNKTGVWDGVPIEYARIQTDSPPRDGWNHDWKR